MPGRTSAIALARGFGSFTPLSTKSTAAASTSAVASTDASTTVHPPSATLRQRSASSNGHQGRIRVRIIEANDVLVLSSRSQTYCLLEVNATTSKSPYAVGVGSSDTSAPACNPVFNYTAEFDLDNDEMCEIRVSVYDRAGAPEDDEGGYVGGGHLKLVLPRKAAIYDERLSLVDRKGKRVDGQLRLKVNYESQKRRKLTPEHFEIYERIGEGAFGVVHRVRKRDTDRIYAMKILSKAAISKNQTASHVIAERKVLQRAQTQNSPFLVGLKFSFQTDADLYLVMDYKPGGELFSHLAANGGRFRDVFFVRFYLAEILLGLEALHARKVVYRDLKPENILLDAMGHIALCDFGLSKALDSESKTRTFCGTGDYLAPETILDEGSGFEADWWAYGVLAYEMFNGYTPFYSEDKDEKYRMIIEKEVKIVGALGRNQEAGDLITKLLCRNPAERLGARGAAEIKAHPFFATLDWEAVAARLISPPFKPPEQTITPSLSPSATNTSNDSSLSEAGARIVPVSRRSSCEHRPTRSSLFRSRSNEPGLDPTNHWHDFSFAAPGHDSDAVSVHSASSLGSLGKGSWSSRRNSRQTPVESIRHMLKMTSA